MLIPSDPLSFEFAKNLRHRLNELKLELNQINGKLDKVSDEDKGDKEIKTFTGIIPDKILTLPFTQIEFGAVEPSGKDIRALTNVKEESLLWNEIEAQTILLPATDEELLKSLNGAFTVEITNLLAADLVQPEYISQVENNMTASDFPEVINEGTKMTLKAAPKLMGANIILGYTISGEKLRIVLSFAYEGHIGVALAPTELAFQRLEFFAFINDDINMVNQISDKTWVDYTQLLKNLPDDEATIVIKNQNILVGVKLAYTAVPTIQVKLVRQKVVSKKDCKENIEPLANFTRNIQISRGKTAFWKTDGILEHVLETYGVVFEITNLLNVALTRPISYLTNGQPFLMPKSVYKYSKDVLISIINHTGVDSGGVISFRIGTTDLLLAIAFQLYNNGNRFAAAFVPLGSPTDRNLLHYLTSNNQWKTSPDQKFGQASEGELVVETRNIRAKVVMTNDLKAVVSVFIKTV